MLHPLPKCLVSLDWWCAVDDFAHQFEHGRVGENVITQWLQRHGASVTHAEHVPPDTFPGCRIYPSGYMKGPHLIHENLRLVLPDLLVFFNGGWSWVEAKHKTCFTWHRKTRQWTTGIDLGHYQQYLHIERATGLPVYLMFYHPQAQPDLRDIDMGSPQESPVGLFGGLLSEMHLKENHTHKNHGRHGMVYWTPKAFSLHYPLENVQ